MNKPNQRQTCRDREQRSDSEWKEQDRLKWVKRFNYMVMDGN